MKGEVVTVLLVSEPRELQPLLKRERERERGREGERQRERER